MKYKKRLKKYLKIKGDEAMNDTETKIINLEQEIEDTKKYICNNEIYEGLIMKFNIEYKTCAVCSNLRELKEINGICRNCASGSKFELNKFEEVRNC